MNDAGEETDSHLRLLVHAGVIDRHRAREAMDAFDQVRAMTWRLPHPPS